MVRPGLDQAEAQARLARWVESLPHSLSCLEERVGHALTCDREGVRSAWGWALPRLSRAVAGEVDGVPEWAEQPWHAGARATYSAETLALVGSLAALYGESLRRHVRSLRWEVFNDPDDDWLEDGDVALVSRTQDGSVWHAVFPLRDVLVQASRAIHGESSPDGLVRVLDGRLAKLAAAGLEPPARAPDPGPAAPTDTPGR